MDNGISLRRRFVYMEITRRPEIGVTVKCAVMGAGTSVKPVLWHLGDFPLSVEVMGEINTVLDAMTTWAFDSVGVVQPSLF
jgi:hypothetical protein